MFRSLSTGVRRARSTAFLRSCLPTFTLMLCCCLPVAQAQSKRERDLDALKARMTVAEARYREALVKRYRKVLSTFKAKTEKSKENIG